jgi:chlorophyllase
MSAAPPPGSGLFVGAGDPYQPAQLAVHSIDVAACERGAPTPIRIHVPSQSAAYPVVLFQHGFMARNSAYDDMLSHLATHGFVVVAPQMYEPGLGPLTGNPTAAQEAELATRVLAWLPLHLTETIGYQARTDLVGIAGHSRGGKVAWLVASADPGRVHAIAGVDPVDGAGGPFGNQPRVINGTFAFSLPALVLGAELGGACAPTGDNHVQFFGASQSPAWHVIATGHGHGDMLDEPEAIAAAVLCTGGPDRAGMRRLTAGLLVALFRAELQGDATVRPVLEGVRTPPILATFEMK